MGRGWAARRRGISEAEVIRNSIRSAVGDERRRPRGGIFASGAPIAREADEEELRQAGSMIERYADQQIGVVDASNVVLAARYRTRTIVTLDRRHFDVVWPLSGGRFTVLP